MANLFGSSYKRDELLQHVGDISQFAGVRMGELSDGFERGVRVADFRTGTGFEFSVLAVEINKTFERSKSISRKFAEHLIGRSTPVQSRIDQNSDSLKVIFTLANGKSLLVNYNYEVQRKSYYLIEKN